MNEPAENNAQQDENSQDESDVEKQQPKAETVGLLCKRCDLLRTVPCERNTYRDVVETEACRDGSNERSCGYSYQPSHDGS